MNGKRIVAIIPARGGSKGVPRKNIKIVKGKPLISYTIKCVKESKLVDDFYVSTEDKKIAEIAKNYNSKVIDRPKRYARDETPDLPVFKHSLLFLHNRKIFPKFIINLRPTAPLRLPTDIDNAIQIILKNKTDSLRSFCKVKEHPYWTYKIENGIAEPFCVENGEKLLLRRQELPDVYIINGAVDIMSSRCLLKDNLYGESMSAYIMPRNRSIDLDTKEDFKRLEKIMDNNKIY